MNHSAEPLLHRAVLEGNEHLLKMASKDPQLRAQKNALGFDALEMAGYLGKIGAVKILQPQSDSKILVLRRGTSKLKILSAAEFKYFFGVVYCPHLFFPDYSFFQQTLKECPWTIRKSFLGQECRNLGRLYQKQLCEAKQIAVSVRWIDDQLGYGLFTEREIPPLSYVGEFTGLVRRLYRRNPNPNAYCFHYPTRFWSWDYTVIDASLYGNETRFINHSSKPNLQPMCACDRNLLHILFFSKDAIAAGTQLTYDYGQDFWLRRSPPEQSL